MTRLPATRSFTPAVAGLVLMLAIVPAASAQPAGLAEVTALVDSFAAVHIDAGRLAGVSVAVVRGGDTLLLRGYGFAELEHRVPTPPRAVYEIGSVTKQFTAAAILLLAEQGRLSLDDELTQHLPDYPTQGHRVTIRRLLDHTSGIRSYTEMQGFGRIMARRLPRDTLVAMIAAEPFDFAPGEALVYNNSAYFLLGLVIEKVSGVSYADFVERHLFTPAGMTDSRYCSETAVVPGRAHGYGATPMGLQRADAISHTWPYAAGSLCSTVGDLVAWNRALHGGRILRPESYAALITPAPLADGHAPRVYAMGIVNDAVAGRRALRHGGGIPGFVSALAWLPEHDLHVVVLMNTIGPASPDALTDAIVERLLGRGPEPAAAPFTGDGDALLGRYVGVGRGAPLAIEILMHDGALAVRTGNGPPRPLTHLGDDTFAAGGGRFRVLREGSTVTAIRADLGSVISVLPRQ